MDSSSERQLEDLRNRLKEIRTARKWLNDFQFNNSGSTTNSKGLSKYLHWLNNQESKTIELGKKIKSQLNLPKQ
ncbi:MAG TPA: hypothetical protein DEV81_07055 [Cyanobacteria bacterium UBA11049]|nr:hypothetical protein [Cyanobacteria bacterium UBA11049]